MFYFEILVDRTKENKESVEYNRWVNVGQERRGSFFIFGMSIFLWTTFMFSFIVVTTLDTPR